ncbi:MAG: M23 family metallopeptidase [Bacteroidales bacterium]|nr:M23 family metallopeptidase [Bacteroidales bacterium]
MSYIIFALFFLLSCNLDSSDDGKPIVTDVKYVLPYPVGKIYTCTQGFNSSPSHFGTFYYSVDFGMSIGTLITATRSGRVVYVVESNSDSDQTPGHENVVIVLHEDTTYARYVHLTYNGALVHVNQTVTPGDTIGLSGSSGTNGGPHLHFDVTRTFTGKSDQTIPFYLKNTSPHPNGLQRGVAYEAMPY